MFAPANPKQARLKIGMYGPPGSGKTFSALLFAEALAAKDGRRIAYVDTERGTDFYAMAVAERKVHPTKFEFDALYSKSLADTTRAVQALDPAAHGVIVLDSISHLWDAAIEAYEGKRTSADTIPMQAWGAIKRPYKALIKFLMEAPYHVFILGRQKNVFEDSDGQLRKVGVGMRAEGETEYEPHLCFRMEGRKSEDGKTTTILCHVEKDRTGILAGRTYPNPTFAMLEPVCALLGEEQAAEEDEDERQAKDSELMAESVEKQAKKDEKSRAIFAQYRDTLHAAKTLADLGAARQDFGKVRRYVNEDHRKTLMVLYEERRKTLAAIEAGEDL